MCNTVIAELYEKCFDKVRDVAKRRGLDDPESVAQDVFVMAIEKGTTEPKILYGMVRNIARNRSKQSYRRHLPLAFEPEAHFEPEPELNIPDELKPIAVLLMNGATKTDVAAILGIMPKTLEKRIERIRKAVA